MTADLLAAHAARLRALDPALGVEGAPPADGELIQVGGALGWACRVDVDPAASMAQWGRLRQYRLVPRWTGDPAELDALLDRWLGWTRAAGAAEAGADSQASLSWPSRDVDAGRVFVAHGLSPGTTVAIRTRGRAVGPPAVPAGVTLRQAAATDADAVRALTLEDIRYEGGLSVLGERPGHEDLRREETAAVLARPDPWAWVAERDGAVVGVVTVDRPADTTWIGGLTSVQPAAYLGLLCVTTAERGRGVGAALVAHAQDTVDRAGTAATLLHYGTFNPLSAPFWARTGWRPLWTGWAAHPASTLR